MISATFWRCDSDSVSTGGGLVIKTITGVGNPPPPFNVAGRILDIFGLRGHPNKGGGLFPHHQDSLRMSDFAFLASQKSSFSTGFIRFFDMAECHVVHSEKPNAF